MNLTHAFINPYAKRPAATASENNDRVNNVTDFSPWEFNCKYMALPLRNVKEGNKVKISVQAIRHRWRCGLCIKPALHNLSK